MTEKFERKSWAELNEIDEFSAGLSELNCEYEDVFLCDGDLDIDGDMDAGWAEALIGDSDSTLIAIKGNLSVNGRLAFYAANPSLLVAGKTSAKTIEAGDCEMSLNGGKASYFVLGDYNDGRLNAEKIDTPFLITNDHDMGCTSVLNGIYIDAFNTRERSSEDCNVFADDLRKVFIDDVLEIPDDEEEPAELVFDSLYEFMDAGTEVLRPEYLADLKNPEK